MISKKMLESLLLEVTRRKKVRYVSVGHDSLERNRVYYIPSHDRILKIYGKYVRWGREVASLNYLKEKSLNVPSMIDYGVYDKDVFWVLMSKVKGQILEDVQSSLTREEHLELLVEIGHYHACFHNICKVDFFGDWDANGSLDSKGSSFAAYISSRNRKRAELTISKGYPETGIFNTAMQKMVSLEYTLKDCSSFSLCHNDFNERNILVKKKDGKWHINGLIDFESCYPTDTEADLARVFFDIYRKEEMDYYLKGYTQVREMSRSFEEKLSYYLLALCFDICSWSYDTAYGYYNRSVKLMERLLEIL